MLLLGIDTCGATGSVALARLTDGAVELLDQIELEGRNYSSTLVESVGELLSRAGQRLVELDALVVVSGPGSFTGVRVGLSAVKGLAHPAAIPVVALSRLAVLAHKAETSFAAIDAHRHEVFLRLAEAGREPRELLAGPAELESIDPPHQVAVCDEIAASLLAETWPGTTLTVVAPPTAAEALAVAVPRILAGQFADLALLDGDYLRRSDAEIFGHPAAASARGA